MINKKRDIRMDAALKKPPRDFVKRTEVLRELKKIL
jgi:hypothetical protein